MKSYHKYYYRDLKNLLKFIVPKNSTSINLKVNNGKLQIKTSKKYDYLILNNLVGDLTDIQKSFNKLKNISHARTRIVITYYNHLWEPVLKFASLMGWRKQAKEQNWLDNKDIENLLGLASLDVVARRKRMLVPIHIPVISDFINKWIAPLPLLNIFCLTTWIVAKPKISSTKNYSVSIIIPARNEEGNIAKIIPQISKFGTKQEVIFVEGHSKDNTWDEINKELNKKRKRGLTIKAYQQKGYGKADAVQLGFSKATGDILMILDADLSVSPTNLYKFYNVLSFGVGEFANGTRLVYPMETDAMRTLNKIGNSIFSLLFTWILGQRFRDTLCGTKVLFKIDYEKIIKNRKKPDNLDPFGDFDLIFGAIKQNLKVVEIPIRYKERVYGSTNINRFRHGLILAKMTFFAYKEFVVF